MSSGKVWGGNALIFWALLYLFHGTLLVTHVWFSAFSYICGFGVFVFVKCSLECGILNKSGAITISVISFGDNSLPQYIADNFFFQLFFLFIILTFKHVISFMVWLANDHVRRT